VLDEVTILYDPNSKEAVMAGFEELYVPVLFVAFAGIVVLGVFVIFPLLLAISIPLFTTRFWKRDPWS
jgi:hypothetical protein